MAVFNYARSQATAERLILRFGQAATLKKIVNSGTEYAPMQTPTDTQITVVDLNHRERDASGALVAQTRRTLLVSTSASVTPEKADTVLIGGTWHEISEVRSLAPGGTLILWEVDLSE